MVMEKRTSEPCLRTDSSFLMVLSSTGTVLSYPLPVSFSGYVTPMEMMSQT